MKGNYDGVCLQICRFLSVVIMYLRKLLGLRFGVRLYSLTGKHFVKSVSAVSSSSEVV